MTSDELNPKRIIKDSIEKKLYISLGKRITDLRKRAGYTSRETFDYDANLPRAQYGRYEQGVNLTINSLSKIVSHHKMSFKEFFEEGFDDLN
jgi:hypothetical protein